ncbi:uncharacterized protein [Choristoneura fumiferana]|uniref:uncharacterized protein n=1 Tax=Choristoneura fumiferana TaxID=7141 RepID=UPI003D15E80E
MIQGVPSPRMEKAKAYIKSSLSASRPSSPREKTTPAPADDVRVCFVCGGAGFSDQFTVRVKADPQSTEPYFPFLGAHAPPTGYRPESADEEGTVRCCCVCYTFLRQQWEQYDRENKPHSQRFYWMKRLDGKPFIGADMSFQGEYAASVLGLGGEPRDEPAPSPRPEPAPPPAPPAPQTNDKGAAQSRLLGRRGGEGVLDLRARDPSVISVGSQHSGASEAAGYLDHVRSTVSVYSGNSNSSSDRDILDLSMPDKNSVTEVCYVCGDEYRRGTLANLHTKPPKDATNKQPYFPIFGEQHPRPPRSRPKDALGTVRACAACHHHLLQQWAAYQMRGVGCSERVYSLRTRVVSLLPPSPLSLASSGDKAAAAASPERPHSQPAAAAAATASFVCYVCGVSAPSSHLRLVYCCANPEREPYYPFITALKPHPDASPISPQGMVQICASCNKNIPHKYPAYGDTEPRDHHNNNAHANNIRFKPYDMKSSVSASKRAHATPTSPHAQPASGENGMGLYR